MKLALVTLHFKNIKDTLELLSSLSKCRIPKSIDFVLYVIDNDNEKDPLLESKLRDAKFPFRFVINNQRSGFAGGNNLGFKIALEDGAEYIGTINNDTFVDKHFFEAVLNSPINDPSIGLVGGLIYFAPGYEFHKKYTKDQLGKVIWYGGGKFDKQNVLGSHDLVDTVDDGSLKNQFETDFVTGCFFIARREVFQKVGMFDEKYFMYLEDLDLNFRVQKAGFKTIVDPNIKIWHKVAQGSSIGSSQNDYYISRNRLYFGFKHLGLRTKFALLREGLKNLFIGSNAQRSAFLDFISHKMGKGTYQK